MFAIIFKTVHKNDIIIISSSFVNFVEKNFITVKNLKMTVKSEKYVTSYILIVG